MSKYIWINPVAEKMCGYEISKIKISNEKKYDIVEMLYCKNGCNNGDGL